MKTRKKLSSVLSLILIFSLLAIPLLAKAKGMQAVVDNNVVFSEDVDGALFISGNNVEVNGDVNGVLFGAGENIRIKGQVKGPIFLAGNIVNFDGKSDGEIFIAGNTLSLNPSSQAQRDVFLAGNIINIDGQVERDAFIAGTSININEQINRDAYLSSSALSFGQDGFVGGDLSYSSEKEFAGVEDYVEGRVEYQAPDRTQARPSTTSTIIKFIRNLIGAMLSAFLIWIFFNKLLDGNFMYTLSSTNNAWINPLLGLGMFILIPIIVFIFFLTTLFIGPGLLIINAQVLIFAFALVLLAAHIERNYLSLRLAEQRYPRTMAFLLAYLVLYLLARLPYIGGIIRILAIAYILGVIVREIYSRLRNNKEEIVL